MKFPHNGLYAITQTEGKSAQRIVAEVEAALRGGVAVVQYRDKHPRNTFELSKTLLALCRHYQVPLIINDDIQLTKASGADGVHLGRDDGSIAEARSVLGPRAIIGISCYDDIDKATSMQSAGADYVAFGRFFPSGSKPLASPARIETLILAKQSISIPIVAIGGVLPENAASLLEAGANVLAVIGGIFDHDPEQSAAAFQPLFS